MDKSRLKLLFEQAMDDARRAEQSGDLNLAFARLEQAHVLGQRWLTRHWRSHRAMLRIAQLRGDAGEARGQLTRLIGLPFFWLVGWVPKGNTGGANVSPLKPMPYSPEMARELAGYRVWRDVLARIAVVAAALAVWQLVRG